METAHSLLPVSAAMRPPAVGACDRPCRSRTLKAPPLFSPAQRMTTIKSDQNSARKTQPGPTRGNCVKPCAAIPGDLEPVDSGSNECTVSGTGLIWGESRGFGTSDVSRPGEAPNFRAETQRPAGMNQRVLNAVGHVAVTKSMEAGGIEPPSCCS